MDILECGCSVRFGSFQPGATGCLARFTDMPERLLLLAAGHVVLPTNARRDDKISSTSDGAPVIGTLLTWTTLTGDPTADTALVWVDPAFVSANIRGLGAPVGANLSAQVGDVIRIIPRDGQSAPRQATISALDVKIDIQAIGPDWSDILSYSGQIVCSPLITEGGDSGAIALDMSNRVVGMVVAGSDVVGTIITPIAAILSNPAWAGGILEILSEIPTGMVPPPGMVLAFPPAITPAEDPINSPERFALDSLDVKQREVATLIIAAFQAAGFSFVQQVAALANASAESSFNPSAQFTNSKEDSVGLFQLNRLNGEGKGFTADALKDPRTQLLIVTTALAKIPAFVQAQTVDDAVASFVRDFERPADAELQVSRRQSIARTFVA